MKARGFLLGLVIGCLGGGLAAAVGIKLLRSGNRAAGPPRVEAAVTVNGDAVPMGTLENQLLLMSGPALLQQMVEQKLIEQEAAKQKVTLTAQETKELDKAAESIKIKPYAQAALERAKVALLARHLLLKGVSEAQIKEVYDLYKPEITQYELFVVVLTTKKDGHDLQRSLQDGVAFDILAKNFSLDPSRKNGGKIGYLTMPQIRRLMGQEAADEVARLKPNQVGKMIYSPHGLIVLKLGSIKSDYQDLKPIAESILAESRRTELMYRLLSVAKVQSHFMQEAPSALPSEDTGGILASPKPAAELPKPGDLPGTGAGQLPKPGAKNPGAGELPKPGQGDVPQTNDLPKPEDN